jgi:glycosyltransferase involved in cell wall biosynthesis
VNPTIDLTLFVACYNEAANIVATLDTVAGALADLGRRCEIIVVDDASRDGSAALVRDYARGHPELPLRLVVQPVNRGLARNFAEAAQLGRGEYYKLVCGDNVESRETLLAVLSRMGRADLVLPFHDACPGKSPFRLFLSRTFTRLVNALTGRSIRYYNGLPLFRRADVLRCCPDTVGFGFQAELVTSLLDRGASFEEVRVEVVERTGGSSTALTWRNFRAVAGTLARIGWRRLRGVLKNKPRDGRPWASLEDHSSNRLGSQPTRSAEARSFSKARF